MIPVFTLPARSVHRFLRNATGQRSAIGLLLITVLTGAWTQAAHAQVEEEDLGEIEMEIFAPREPLPVDPALASRFRDAQRTLLAGDPLGALPQLDQTIEDLSLIAEGANPPPAGRSLFARCLLTRAQIRIDHADTERAVEDLRRAISSRPSLTVDRDRASSLLVAQFDAIRDEMVGTLDLPTIEPIDLELRIDDRLVTDARDPTTGALTVLAGSRTLRARRPGYAAYAVTIEIPAGATVPVDVVLQRTGPVLRVITRPHGATVVLDGVGRGVTLRDASSSPTVAGASSDASARIFSAPFLMSNVPLGNHQLEVQLNGHRSFRAPLTIAEAIDYEIPPIVLETERGRLLLRSLESEARVRINGQAVDVVRSGSGGTVELPPGHYEVVVDRGPTAMFTRRLQLADRQTIEIDVRLRPGLGLFSVLGDDTEAKGRVSRMLAEAVANTGRWTMVDHGASAASILATHGVTAQALRSPMPAIDWTTLQGALDRETAGLLYVLPVLSDDLLATHVDLWIWPGAPGPARPDRVRIALSDADAKDRVSRLLGRSIQLHRPWLGAQVIDSAAAQHPLVVAVAEGSPAAAAGLRPGDEIAAVAKVPIRTAVGLEERINAAEIGEAILLDLRGPAGNRNVTMTLAASPIIMDHHNSDRLYAVAYADLTLIEQEVPAADRWIVQLNRAKVFLHLRDWIGAARELRTIQPPATPVGVGQASIDYWLGVALAAAGTAYRETAIDAFERAASQPTARLLHNDGPWVAPRARARRHALASDR